MAVPLRCTENKPHFFVQAELSSTFLAFYFQQTFFGLHITVFLIIIFYNFTFLLSQLFFIAMILVSQCLFFTTPCSFLLRMKSSDKPKTNCTIFIVFLTTNLSISLATKNCSWKWKKSMSKSIFVWNKFSSLKFSSYFLR